MNVWIVIFAVINIVLFLHTSYYVVFTIYGLFRRTKKYADTDQRKHFAAVIAARNEELVIGNLVESLKAADYPPELLDIYVFLTNCTDKTGEIAGEHGANVVECKIEAHSKGDVLRYVFNEFFKGKSEIEAYAVFDADNVVDAELFNEMNKALSEGCPVVQGMRRGKNMSRKWISASYEIFYAMQNVFYNHPRSSAGLTAVISGTGWVADKAFIDRIGYDMNTITEDYEMNNKLALCDERIAYCRDAIVFDEFTEKLSVSVTQRIRWTVGLYQSIRKYEGKLIKKALRFGHGSWLCFDVAHMNLLLVVMLISSVVLPVSYFVFKLPISFAMYLLLMLAGFWITISLCAAVAVLKSGIGLKENMKGVLAFPLFMITWVPILAYCLFKRDVEWKPIKHDMVISIEEREGAE